MVPGAAGSGGNGSGGNGSGGTDVSGGATNGGDGNGGTSGDTSNGGEPEDGSVAADPDLGSCGTRDERDYGDRFTRPEVPDASVPMEPEDAGVDGGVTSAPSVMGWPVAEENGLSLQVQFRAGGQASEIAGDFRVINGTGDDVSLDDVSFRYYYVASFTPVVEVDHAAIMLPEYQAITGNVIRTVTPDYVEFSFDDDILFPDDGVLTVQARIHSDNYQGAFDKCESFSFEDAPATTTLADYAYIPVYYQGDLVYGIQPVLAQ
jgi:hypothetical protein